MQFSYYWRIYEVIQISIIHKSIDICARWSKYLTKLARYLNSLTADCRFLFSSHFAFSIFKFRPHYNIEININGEIDYRVFCYRLSIDISIEIDPSEKLKVSKNSSLWDGLKCLQQKWILTSTKNIINVFVSYYIKSCNSLLRNYDVTMRYKNFKKYVSM